MISATFVLLKSKNRRMFDILRSLNYACLVNVNILNTEFTKPVKLTEFKLRNEILKKP